MSKTSQKPSPAPANVDGFAPVEDLVAAIGAGQLVVIVDDTDRENEGDLICSAEAATPELINFMITHGRGLVCVPMLAADLERLELGMMPNRGHENTAINTAFTEAVDARVGTTTGISAAERANTIQVLANPETTPGDLMIPGHIFPLRAHPDGVLGRPGHTEAAVDLARLAGKRPAGVLCEILNRDGSMARRDDLFHFCRAHNLLLGTIKDLVEYRRQHPFASTTPGGNS